MFLRLDKTKFKKKKLKGILCALFAELKTVSSKGVVRSLTSPWNPEIKASDNMTCEQFDKLLLPSVLLKPLEVKVNYLFHPVFCYIISECIYPSPTLCYCNTLVWGNNMPFTMHLPSNTKTPITIYLVNDYRINLHKPCFVPRSCFVYDP